MYNQPIFSKLFGGNFCEQQPVLGKLLNTVKMVGYSALKSLKSIIPMCDLERFP